MHQKIEIVREFKIEDFKHTINQRLAKGWELQGQMVVAPDGALIQMMWLSQHYTDKD